MMHRDNKVVHFPQSHPDNEFLSLTFNQKDAVRLISNLSDVPRDFIIKSRIKYGSRWSVCKGLPMEYSKSTTVHGIRYLFEVHRPFYEK